MNANLQYDRIYDQVQSADPWLTEKTLSNLVFAPRAMLYIDNIESNVVRFENRQQIVDTIEKRWDGGKVIAAFLDGHAERLAENDIPAGDPRNDRESSRFWRGLMRWTERGSPQSPVPAEAVRASWAALASRGHD